MDEEEFSYFAPDRLVGVLGIEDAEQPESSAHVFHLIHLTSRFGAFIRESDQWQPLALGWNPDPDYKYINFKESSYDTVVRAFDSAERNRFFYEDVKEHQEILDWEGSYDNTIAPFCFRDIEELINWTQDFVEPKPVVITYGRGRVSMSDMEWMRHDVADLEELQSETEAYVLRQRKKSGSQLLEDKLKRIEMYPPLNQAVDEAFSRALGNAGDCESDDDLLAEYSGGPLATYLAGGAVSMRELHETHLELLASGFSYQFPLGQLNIDNKRLIRESWLMPKSRLEAWFVGHEDMIFFDLVLNTEFGLYKRKPEGGWIHFTRDNEVEDIIDLAGGTIFHVRPEREQQVIEEFDKGNLHALRLTPTVLNKYRVYYGGDSVSESDMRDRSNVAPGSSLKYSSMNRTAARLVQDTWFKSHQSIKFLIEQGYDLDAELACNSLLEDFYRGKIELTNSKLKFILNTLLREDENGESLTRRAQLLRNANESQIKLEKLIEKQDVDYLPESSLNVYAVFDPEFKMWLKYRSAIYGYFGRHDSQWLVGSFDGIDDYPVQQIYYVKEERVNDLVALFDGINAGTHRTSIEDIAQYLVTYRTINNDVSEKNPNDWDMKTFTRDEMAPSTGSVMGYYYEQVMTSITDYSKRFEEDDEVGIAQVADWMAEIEGEAMIDFMNRERSINRRILSIFMDCAPDLILDIDEA